MNNYPPLTLAADNAQVESMRLLLKDGRADPSLFDSLVLSAPSDLGEDVYEIVQLLLDDGRANPDDGDSEPFILTVTYGGVRCLALLLKDKRTRPWARDGKALVDACETGNIDTAKLLLSDDRTYPAIDGNTPLKRAITIHNILAVELLLANVEVLEELNESDLELAEQQPYVDRQVETLIRAALERKSDR